MANRLRELADSVWWCGICNTHHFVGDPCPKTRIPRKEEKEEIERLNHAHMLKYFHEEKGNMRRYTQFDEAIKHYPHVKKALEDYETARLILDVVVKDL